MPPPFPSSSDRSINPTDLSNILQGDDSNRMLDTSLDNTNPPTDFSEPNHMDAHNQGDHDSQGRFNPFGGLPPNQRPDNPLFTRQTAPLMGGTHANNDNRNTDQQQGSSIQAPTLGEKRQDEPDQDRIGLDPSQDFYPKSVNAKEGNQGDYKQCFKLQYRQPLTLNQPSVLVLGLEKMGFKYLLMTALMCLYIGQNGYSLLVFVITCGTGALAFYSLSSNVLQSLLWQIEKINGTNKLGKRDSNGESMEWFNSIAEKIWRSVDPKTFTILEDILEDMLATVAPAIIKAARVNDFDLGTAAPRIEKMQIFPPGPNQLPDTIFGTAEFSLRASSSSVSVAKPKSRYVTPPGVSIRFKTSVNAAVDVRGELTKLVGKVRFKIVTAPEPPFVSKVTFSFTEAPLIETSVMPVTKRLNIMRLPMLKTLVDEAVKLGFAQLIDPESMTIDVAQIMAAQSDTAAIGLVQLQVRQLETIHPKSQDPENIFVTLSSSSSLKNDIKSTRVLSNKLNPTWNENLYQLITLDDISNDIYLDIKILKASKLKSDELLGSVSVSVKDIVLGVMDANGNVSKWCTDERVMFDGWCPCDAKPEKSPEIKLNFKLSFHPKYVIPSLTRTKTEIAKKEKAKKKAAQKEKKRLAKQARHQKKFTIKQKRKAGASKDNSVEVEQLQEIVQKLKEEAFAAGITSSKAIASHDLKREDVIIVSDNDSNLGKTELVPKENADVPETLLDTENEFEDISDDSEFEPGETVSPHHLSGILSINIAEAKDLDIMAPDMINSEKRRHPYNPDKPVNPYAIIYLNDHKIYETRSKMSTANPCWNADTECFVKNYGTSFIRISVKTSIDLEDDPVIGTVVLKVSELFEGHAKKVKEAQRWISLVNGIGSGKVLLNLTFKPIKLTLPKELLGADVGTLVVQNIKLVDVQIPLDNSKVTGTQATLALNVEPKIEKYLQPDSMVKLNDGISGWINQDVYFPLLMRYRTAIFVHLSQGTISTNKVTARLWMKEILDYDWQEVTLALHEFTSETSTEGNEDENSWGTVGPCGSITVRLKFVPGFSPAHTLLPSFTADMLGADPFYKDDNWEKAHLLVQHESSENYATQDLASPTVNKDKRQKLVDHINDSKLFSMTKKTAKSKKSVVPTMQEQQKQEIVDLLHDGEESNNSSPVNSKGQHSLHSTESATGTFDIFKEESYLRFTEKPTTMEPMAIPNATEANSKRASISDSHTSAPVSSFDTLKRAPCSSTNNRRSSFVENLDAIPDKRLSKASTSSNPPVYSANISDRRASTIKKEAAPPYSSNNTTDLNNVPLIGANKANEIEEVEAVAYLDTMQDDLKNSKIHNYKVLRKLAKGKSFLTQPFSAFKQGHNSEARANKSVKREA